MALDLNKVKSRLNQLQSKGKKNADGSFEKTDYTKYYYKPIEGTQTIRIVPSKTSPSYPLVTVSYHNDIIKKKYLALSNFGEADPIVKFSEDLRNSEDKEDRNIGWSLKPKDRIFAQVLVRGQENRGVLLWEFGREVEGQILKLLNDKEYGDITDVNEGTDLTITGAYDSFSNGSGKSTKYIKPSILPQRRTSPLADTEDLINKYLNEQHDPLELPFQKRYSYDEILGFLEKFLNPEGVETNASAAEEVKEEHLGNEDGNILDVSAEAEPSDDKDEVIVGEEDNDQPFVEDQAPVVVAKPKNAIAAASKRIVAQDKKVIAPPVKIAKETPTVLKKETVTAQSKKSPVKETPKAVPVAGESKKDKFNAIFGKK